MLTTEKIQQLATNHQTTELNIRREYFQQLFLSYFYQQKETTGIYFKGGTALRIIYNSPRFSEDLDFSSPQSDVKTIEMAVENTLHALEKENVQVRLEDASPTSGGYVAVISFADDYQPINIQLEISLRQGEKRGEVATIASDFVLPYTLIGLSQEQLVEEKIQALLARKKPRDFYDLYFILRKNLLPASEKNVLREALKTLRVVDINFEHELKIFLPRSQWAIIRDFKQTLEREIERFT